MSSEEMRDFCQSLCNFKVRAQIRLKNGTELLLGRITGVEAERFEFRSDGDDVVQHLRYAWVARIKSA